MALTLTRERVEDTVARYVYPRPITFDEWLETEDRTIITDLINGTPIEKHMVQLEHEKLNLWLLVVLVQYVRRKALGAVLGTRSPVRIDEYSGRLPDLFFVRNENLAMITSKATLVAPDLVMELISPNDRRADINASEADYRTLGVSEIVYIDQQRMQIRVIRKRDVGYDEEVLKNKPLRLNSLAGVTLEWDWLFVEPRPDEMDTVLALLKE